MPVIFVVAGYYCCYISPILKNIIESTSSTKDRQKYTFDICCTLQAYQSITMPRFLYYYYYCIVVYDMTHYLFAAPYYRRCMEQNPTTPIFAAAVHTTVSKW